MIRNLIKIAHNPMYTFVFKHTLIFPFGMTVHLFEMFGHTALIPAQMIMLGKLPMSQPDLVFRNKVNKFCHLANSRLIGHY